MDQLAGAQWRKSSFSGGNGGNCVEVASNLADAVGVRDSKDPGGPELAFAPAAWAELTAAVKAGQLDLA
jgi:hypothetical protein